MSRLRKRRASRGSAHHGSQGGRLSQKTLDRQPPTRESLGRDLRVLGVDSGMTLMVHSSLRAIGWVLGGAPSVVAALGDVIGDSGTLVMPSATPYCGDPASWTNPSVAEEQLDFVREHLPLFDVTTTPTTMGAIAETFRTWPGTLRSDHPLESVCARGPLAPDIIRDHPLAFSEGQGGPFDELHAREAWILLLGVGFNRCTALHYAESLVPNRRTMTVRFARVEEGRRVWMEVPNVADDNNGLFPLIGDKYVGAGRPKLGSIGQADSRLFPMKDLVGFATRYFAEALS